MKIDFTNLPLLTNSKFYPLYFDQNRYEVLVGGGGSGKSVFAASKNIYRCLAEPGHKILVVRKVADTLRETAFAELVECIRRWGLEKLWHIPKGKSSKLSLDCVNGSSIVFSGLDDVEKLKSIVGVTSIWIEEASEIEVTDFRQLDIRLRGTPGRSHDPANNYYKQIIISFNPIYKGHWLEQEFIKDGWKPRNKNTTVHHSTYKDNKWLDPENKKVLESFKETDPYYYSVYCLGEWGVLGQTVFPARIVTERIQALRSQYDPAPPLKGLFLCNTLSAEERIDPASIAWLEDPSGYVTVYKPPEPYTPYVIGGDTAGEGSDYFVGQVLNNITGEQVATLCHRFDEDLFAKQMFCLGKYYNNALIGVETNFSTYPVKTLLAMGYNHQFARQKEDTYTHKLAQKFGFQTNKLTRPLIIADLIRVVRDDADTINDIETLEEMLTFVRNEQGRAEAQAGKHDDRIMALAIAHYIRAQAPTVSSEPVPVVQVSQVRAFKEQVAKRQSSVSLRNAQSPTFRLG